MVTDIKTIIENAVLFQAPEYEEITEGTALMGPESVLDSMGLVLTIVDIEQQLSEEGITVSLTSDAAMSAHKSPFRTVQTLTDYVNECINNGSK